MNRTTERGREQHPHLVRVCNDQSRADVHGHSASASACICVCATASGSTRAAALCDIPEAHRSVVASRGQEEPVGCLRVRESTANRSTASDQRSTDTAVQRSGLREYRTGTQVESKTVQLLTVLLSSALQRALDCRIIQCSTRVTKKRIEHSTHLSRTQRRPQ